jgi:hypothetical protein
MSDQRAVSARRGTAIRTSLQGSGLLQGAQCHQRAEARARRRVVHHRLTRPEERAQTAADPQQRQDGEEFQIAREFYDETLALAPMFRMRSSETAGAHVLSRHEDAMAVADELIAISRYPGDTTGGVTSCRQRYDPRGWTSSGGSLADQQRRAEAGRHVAINRHEIDVARRRLRSLVSATRTTARRCNTCTS